MVGDREKCLAAGAVGYIEKPINPESFVAELVSGKSLDLAVQSDSFASKPNEKITEPIRRKNISRQYGPEPRGLVL